MSCSLSLPSRDCHSPSLHRRSHAVTVNNDDAIKWLLDACEQLPHSSMPEGPEEAEKWEEFLSILDTSSVALELEIVPRRYREEFTANYRALFPTQSRHYRLDILRSALEFTQEVMVMWVNGTRHEFSQTANALAVILSQEWHAVLRLLKAFVCTRTCEGSFSYSEPSMLKIMSRALNNLDRAWAEFESQYVQELIQIEDAAKEPLLAAAFFEKALSVPDITEEEHEKVLQCFVGSLGRLNSLANSTGKGRDNLCLRVLQGSQRIVSQHSLLHFDYLDPVLDHVAHTLANDVVETFEQMRQYVRDTTTYVDMWRMVDPRLENNTGLSHRLADLEESWDIAEKYLLDEKRLAALTDLVAELHSVQNIFPSLQQMAADRDVEFVMALPRLVWLHHFALQPRNSGILENFRPAICKDSTKEEQINSALNSYQAVIELLCSLPTPTGEIVTQSAVKIPPLAAAQIAVKGWALAGGDQDVLSMLWDPSSNDLEPARLALQALMLRVEGLSVDLQRHNPEEWNQFIAVAVKCFTCEKLPKRPQFEV
eukprot:gnl/MRDRNA2_/MRDRNA2_31459_c0_seq1.p1 gnl/MRDRNA2_/MRDRNA2_31459_c0~~gnl/MRDRNA2_/MRDRNA2_31459_c0_seq1.p1  ORF type:complete len:540 (-),score=106.19 gnl/MRDRNA2_/MRDRNA2_31459_c0_seq1:68-1687(-)